MVFSLQSDPSLFSFDFKKFPNYVVVTYRGRSYVSRITHPTVVILHKNTHHYIATDPIRALDPSELQSIKTTHYSYPPLFIKAHLVEHFTLVDTDTTDISVADVRYDMVEMFLTNTINPSLSKSCRDMAVHLVLDHQVNQKQALFHTPSNTLYLVLCLFRKKKCLSSITFQFLPSTILIESKTLPSEENKTYNTLLRAITILIADKMLVRNQPIQSIVSQPIHWVSAWLLSSKFGFENGVRTTNKQDFRKQFQEDHDYTLTLTTLSYKRAWHVYEQVVKNLPC